MSNEFDIPDGWELSSHEEEPTECYRFENGDVVATLEYINILARGWQATLGHRDHDPVVVGGFGKERENAVDRVEELMENHEEYVNPTTYTIEVKLSSKNEDDVRTFIEEGGYAVSENTDNTVLRTEIADVKGGFAIVSEKTGRATLDHLGNTHIIESKNAAEARAERLTEANEWEFNVVPQSELEE